VRRALPRLYEPGYQTPKSGKWWDEMRISQLANLPNTPIELLSTKKLRSLKLKLTASCFLLRKTIQGADTKNARRDPSFYHKLVRAAWTKSMCTQTLLFS
jgi:hypothetical protein